MIFQFALVTSSGYLIFTA